MLEELGTPMIQKAPGSVSWLSESPLLRETAKKLPFICDPVRVTQDDVEDATRTILTDLKD